MLSRNPVESFFGDTQNYLRFRYYIDLRAQVVRELCGPVRNARILDVGCGDGTISRLLCADGDNELCLVDISAQMLDQAKRNFASIDGPNGRVTYHLGDIHNCELPHAAFDYILAVGVLAHVPDAESFIARLSRLLVPSGHMVLQFTDFGSPLGALQWFHQAAKEAILRRRRYSLNRLRRADVEAAAACHGLQRVASRRHSLILPGMDRFLPDHFLFRCESAARKITISRWLGAECTLLLQKKHP